ncbi:MAG: hypothetical protein Q8O64_15615, partial [Sideroxyarcus sp.]|nr:hypothetical protein [Sideroxyarcus sp.]
CVKHAIVIRSYSVYSIRDRGDCLIKNPDVWLQSLPSQNHRLKAWQKSASMYGLQFALPFFSSPRKNAVHHVHCATLF